MHVHPWSPSPRASFQCTHVGGVLKETNALRRRVARHCAVAHGKSRWRMARVDHDERRKGRTVDEKCVETPLKTTEHMTSQRTDADWAKTIHRQHIFKNKTRWQSSNTRLVPPLLATIARGPSLGRWLGNLPFQEVDFSHAVFLLHCGAHVPVTLGPLGSGRSTLQPPEVATWPSTTPVAPCIPPAVPVTSAHSLSAPAPPQVSGAAAQPPPLELLLPTSGAAAQPPHWNSCYQLP